MIVDAGRIGSVGLPTPLVERSALTALVLGSSLRAVMSARVHLPTITDHSRLSSSARHPFGLVVVGEGQPYAGGEISKALGLPVVTTVARDPQAAAHLSDGADPTSPLRLVGARPQPARCGHQPGRQPAAFDRAGAELIMSDTTDTRSSSRRARRGPDARRSRRRRATRRTRLTVDRSRLVDGFGIFSRDDVRDRLSHTRIDPPAGGLDWAQVVDLRRRASEAITEEAAAPAPDAPADR